ncbi:MAG TPA: hypothetical protein VHC90_01800 [Bryobacteraceae bacterium]|nr:hypothetical protein [Bryobacteraceae bacterium]
MKRLGETEAIAEAEFHDEIILIARAAVEFGEPVVVGIGVEREGDGGEAAAGGVCGAQGVIPDSWRGAGDAEVPEAEASSGGLIRGARGEAFGDPGIADDEDFGAAGSRRGFDPVEVGFERAGAGIGLEVCGVPPGAKEQAIGREECSEREDNPQETGTDVARADFSIIR